MIDWIDINLPWKKCVELEDPQYPAELVDSLTRERFGFTKEEFSNAFEDKHGQAYWQVSYSVECREKELLMKECNIESTYDWTDEQHEEFEAEKARRVNDVTRNHIMAEVQKHIATLKAMNEFAQNLPEVDAWGKECQRIHELEREEEKKVSFYASDLRRPGVLIEVQHENVEGTVVRKYLIGNMNCVGVVCDDCVAFENDAVVLRAKVLCDQSDF